MTLTVGSLFSGIGGFDLGLERAGMKVIWQSEIDQFACKVLQKHWPSVPNLGDITKIDWTKIERPDIVCGGYPCQPFSTAGRRGGENDPRHLWPAMHNAICQLRPRYAIMENVRGHLSLGFGRVLGDLAEIGYDTEWQVIPAAAVGAPHKRDRVFIVAYPNSEGRQRGSRVQTRKTKLRGFDLQGTNSGRSSDLANANSRQVDGGNGGNETNRSQIFSRRDKQRGTASDEGWKWWEFEPDLGRVANGVPNRVDRLKGLGNAIVPQVAELVGALVVEHSQN